MMKNGCIEEPNTGYVYDPRFTVSGLYTNVYDVQEQNNVLSLLSHEPSYSHYCGNSTSKHDYFIRSWNRPTLTWSLECEY